MTISEITAQFTRGTTTAREVTQTCLAQIAARDGEVKAFLGTYDDALAMADAADAMREAGTAGPLTGVPVALKDNLLCDGHEVTAASKILEGYQATYDATVVARLKAAGAVLIGRTNCDEFAMGSSTENSAYQQTTNPHDPTRVPGGSSGGSAAAVAADMVPVALGSDTGGSIRQPGSFCGVVGLKPTYGSVSRSGLIAMGSSLDVVGPLTRTVDDAASVFAVLKGHDPHDSTTIPQEQFDAVAERDGGPRFIGVPRDFLAEGVDASVMRAFEATLERLAGQGYEVVDVELPHVRHALAVYYIIMPAEAATNLERFDGMRYGRKVEGDSLMEEYVKTRGQGFGPEPRRRILLGTYALSAGYYDAYYGTATKVRSLIRREFEEAFGHVDAIVTPTAPTPAFPIGAVKDPLSMYLADVFTVPANIAGIPALSVPMGVHEEEGARLPLGLQLMAPRLGERTLFHIGRSVEAGQ
ncbi:Asp-tRNA(Asn)/Glu-tRNA(Gln) amidotransferase subunit GatA [Patescibacteria group bacterium]|jgi:aspartyl-tRNA(Asn)/glutamyl-tRNA(Gln) amidotransferase subunit A|nr:Asp-tRNA(Asn)/Glu-tRNA(Gln) amidotransferase subunit GatA [Patescibacteria group bacterium]